MAGAAPVARPQTPSRRGSRAAGAGWPTVKLVLLAVVLIGLGAIIGFSVSRELASPATSSGAAAQVRLASRPALTADEQAYVAALWPIHGELEVAAERIALGTIFYTTRDLERAELRTRLDQALASFRAADSKLGTLNPPRSMESSHAGYVSAVSLFEQSTVEMLKMFDDGNDDHLQTGYPLYLEGTNKVRDLGGTFWPDEFPPN